MIPAAAPPCAIGLGARSVNEFAAGSYFQVVAGTVSIVDAEYPPFR